MECVPNKTLAVSITGRACSLNCEHCNRKYLEGMVPIEQMENKLEKGEYSSILASGGCDSEGRVRLDLFSEQFIYAKKKHRIKIVAHTGLTDEGIIKKISTFADIVSFDFIWNDEAIAKVYGLNKRKEDFLNSLLLIIKHLPVVPHITIGLNYGKTGWEKEALEILRENGFKKVVLNVIVPARSTGFEKIPPPKIEEVVAVFRKAHASGFIVFAGCMRPGGKYRKELDEGIIPFVERIVNPDRSLYGGKIQEECCIL